LLAEIVGRRPELGSLLASIGKERASQVHLRREPVEWLAELWVERAEQRRERVERVALLA